MDLCQVFPALVFLLPSAVCNDGHQRPYVSHCKLPIAMAKKCLSGEVQFRFLASPDTGEVYAYVVSVVPEKYFSVWAACAVNSWSETFPGVHLVAGEIRDVPVHLSVKGCSAP